MESPMDKDRLDITESILDRSIAAARSTAMNRVRSRLLLTEISCTAPMPTSSQWH